VAHKSRCAHCVTPTQAQILVELSRGQSYDTIGQRLYLAPTTVAYHVAKLQAKFRVPNRAALVAAAFVFGILAGDQWPIEASGLLHATLAESCDDALDASTS
jgi:DNA-binding CsgD family transcriptional regulator